ncbi:MAG: NAD-dependent epimerase/dehydratase family protein [Hyphomicrobiaceae bacterium]
MSLSTTTAAIPVKGAHILIVGGASLVGSASAELFLQQGASKVTIADNFYQGTPGSLDHIRDDPRLAVVRGDVMRLNEMIAVTQDVDCVLQLAALMTISIHEDPWRGLDVNIRGVQNVLEACALNNVKKVVFASSNAAYGYGPGIVGDLTEATPFHSEDAPPAAILYGGSKIIGEQLCRDYYRKRGLNFVILRYSTVYGERQHYRAANALYIIETHDRVLNDQPPQVIGDGLESKHFVHVSDVARANACAFESPATDVAVNISGPEPTTTLEIVKLVTELAGKSIVPEHVEPDPGKVRLTSGGPWRMNHTRAKDLIGWAPEIDMREGIARLLHWRSEANN